MKVMYMNGTTSYIDVILKSNGIDDFISRLEDVKKIVIFDENVINDLKKQEEAVSLKKVALKTENTKLLSLRVENKEKLTVLSKQKSDETVFVAQLNAQENQYGAQLVTDQATAARESKLAKEAIVAARQAPVATKAAPAMNQVASSPRQAAVATTAAPAMNQVANNVAPSSSGSSASSSAIIAYASNFLGIPYVWGGTSPSGFDCSGFTQYVFAHFGINLPRVSQDQQNVGTYESRANLQPGDLVFFGSPAHHVGIYVGNGDYINSPHTGADLCIAPLDYDFTYGRRVN
jgi:cell wall-associated NlpC family hydrolase